MGDRITMADRFETELNEAIPGDIRDTSTAKAIATNLKAFTVGNALPVHKRNILTEWMKGNATGDKLIRAGVPTDWVVGDKSELEVMGHEMTLLSFGHQIEHQLLSQFYPVKMRKRLPMIIN